MSMISSQCDERLDERLRRAAQTCRELGKHTTANMFLEAADIILELRGDLQRANDAVQDAEHDESMAWDRVRKAEAENVKLREERDHWHVEQVHAYGNWEDAHKRAAELELENAKLRSLVRKWYPHMLKRVGRDALKQWGQMDVVKELRVEA